jgi:hypothetical protein
MKKSRLTEAAAVLFSWGVCRSRLQGEDVSPPPGSVLPRPASPEPTVGKEVVSRRGSTFLTLGSSPRPTGPLAFPPAVRGIAVERHPVPFPAHGEPSCLPRSGCVASVATHASRHPPNSAVSGVTVRGANGLCSSSGHVWKTPPPCCCTMRRSSRHAAGWRSSFDSRSRKRVVGTAGRGTVPRPAVAVAFGSPSD